MRHPFACVAILLAAGAPHAFARGMHLGDGRDTWATIVFVAGAVGIYYVARTFPRFLPALGALLVLAIVSTATATALAGVGVIPKSAVPVAIYYSLATMLMSCGVGFIVRRQKRRRKV